MGFFAGFLSCVLTVLLAAALLSPPRGDFVRNGEGACYYCDRNGCERAFCPLEQEKHLERTVKQESETRLDVIRVGSTGWNRLPYEDPHRAPRILFRPSLAVPDASNSSLLLKLDWQSQSESIWDAAPKRSVRRAFYSPEGESMTTGWTRSLELFGYPTAACDENADRCLDGLIVATSEHRKILPEISIVTIQRNRSDARAVALYTRSHASVTAEMALLAAERLPQRVRAFGYLVAVYTRLVPADLSREQLSEYAAQMDETMRGFSFCEFILDGQ